MGHRTVKKPRKVKPVSDKTLDIRFRSEVRQKKGWRCLFERLRSWGEWTRCGHQAPHVCHIIRRSQAPAIKRDERNAIPGCVTCHREYDTYVQGVRVPLRYWNQAITADEDAVLEGRAKVRYHGEWRSL